MTDNGARVDVSTWRKKRSQTREIVFEGLTFKVKKPRFMTMVRRGMIGGDLFKSMMTLMDKEEKKDLSTMDTAAVKNMIDLIDMAVIDCVVEPKVVRGTPKDGEVSVDDLEDKELFQLFNLTQQTMAASGGVSSEELKPFPK